MPFADFATEIDGALKGAAPPPAPADAPPISEFHSEVNDALKAPPSERPEGYYGGRLHLNVTKGPNTAQAATPVAEGVVPVKTGATEALGRGVASGLTANFFDELRGLHEAGGGEPGGLSLGPIIYGAYKRLSNDPEALKRYEATVEEERGREKQLQQEHPAASLGGNVLGAVAMPVGAAAGAATLPVRMARGAVVGGAYGALSGAGEGTSGEDRAVRAASGGAIGAAAGGAAPMVLAGIGAASRAGGSVLGHPIQTINQARDIDAAAAKKIAASLEYDMANGRGGMSGADVQAAQATGQNPVILDLGGEGTRALARSAANTSPGGRAALEDVVKPRFAEQSTRVADFLRNIVPTPANATRTQEALETAARAANKPAYDRAYAQGARGLWSPELERLAGSGAVSGAMKGALGTMRDEAILGGYGVMRPPFRVDPQGGLVREVSPTGIPIDPDLRFWDLTRRKLSDAAISAGRGTDEARRLNSFAKALNSELDRLVPSYAQARAGAASFFGAENALEAGQKFVSMSGSLAQSRQAINKMSAPERTLFAEGFVSSLVDKVQKIADNRSVTIDRIFNSTDGKARIAMALGSSRAGELEAFLRRENMMDLARTAVTGNSTTVRQLIEKALSSKIGHGIIGGAIGGGIESLYSGEISPTAVIGAAVLGGMGTGRAIVNAKLSQRVAEMLASNDPAVNAQVYRMATNNPQVRSLVRGAESWLEKIAGNRAGNAAPMLPSAAVSRADQQQQQ